VSVVSEFLKCYNVPNPYQSILTAAQLYQLQ
jgi:hypothetical protein